jgi:hypothetical protein
MSPNEEKTRSAAHMAVIALCAVTIVCLIVLTFVAVDCAHDFEASSAALPDTLSDVRTAVQPIAPLLEQTTATLKTAQTTIAAAQPVLNSAAQGANQINAAMLAFQRPCDVHNIAPSPFHTSLYSDGSVMPCGPLADWNQALGTMRGTFGEFESFGRHFNQNLPVYDAQELALFNDVHGSVTDMRGYLKSKAVADFQADMFSTVHSFAGIANDGQHMVSIGNQVETKLTYSYLHPSKNPWVRTGNALKPYAPLAVKTAACWAVPGSCF